MSSLPTFFWVSVELMLLVKQALDKDLVLATNQHKRLDLAKLAPVEQEIKSTLVGQIKTVAWVEVRWAELVVRTEVVETVAHIKIDATVEQLI